MMNILYGNKKLMADFEFMFKDIGFEQKIVEDVDDDRLLSVIKEIDDLFVYVCSKKYDNVKKELEHNGLKEEIDFINAISIFKYLDYDIDDKTKNKRIVVWGKGAGYKDLCDRNPEIIDKIEMILDNAAERNEVINGIPVISPDDLKNADEYFCIITVRDDYRAVESQLRQMGFDNGSYVFYERIFQRPSELLIRTYMDEPMKPEIPICSAAFEYIEIHTTGEVTACCPNWANMHLGNLLWDKYSELYTSVVSKIFKLSVINGTYSFCHLEQCPFLQTYSVDKGEKYPKYEKGNTDLCIKWDDAPIKVSINIDNTCNLHCVSCRKKIVKAEEKEVERRNRLTNIISLEILPKVNNLTYAGNGEVFLSDVYRKLIKEGRKDQQLMLLSNGTLFSIEKFEEFANCFGDIGISISIDAATKETYEKIRRGGKWNDLIHNLEQMKKLREINFIKIFTLNFVISAENVQEIDKFIELGKKMSADRVSFTKLINWGTYSEEEFETQSVFDNAEKIKPQYKKYIEQSNIKHQIADSCNLVSIFRSYGGHSANCILDYEIHPIVGGAR